MEYTFIWYRAAIWPSLCWCAAFWSTISTLPSWSHHWLNRHRRRRLQTWGSWPIVPSRLASSTPRTRSIFWRYFPNGIKSISHNPHYVSQAVTDSEYLYFIRKKISSTGNTSEVLLLPPEEGIARVRLGNFAYHSESYYSYSIVTRLFSPAEICDFREIDFRKNGDYGIVLKKHSPFRDRVSTIWFWMRETGIFSKHFRYWKIQKPPCLNKSMFMQVGFNYLGSLLVFFTLACTLSSIILVCELVHSRLTWIEHRLTPSIKNWQPNSRANVAKSTATAIEQ